MRTGRRAQVAGRRGFCPLLCGRARRRGGACSVADLRLAVAAAFPRTGSDTRHRHPADRRRDTRGRRFLGALRPRGPGHAGADRAAAEARRDGSLPLCAQPDVRLRHRRHSGLAVLLGDARLAAYGALAWIAFHAFVVGYEEPRLAHRFGTQYDLFRADVPRWIPRPTPWRQGQS